MEGGVVVQVIRRGEGGDEDYQEGDKDRRHGRALNCRKFNSGFFFARQFSREKWDHVSVHPQNSYLDLTLESGPSGITKFTPGICCLEDAGYATILSTSVQQGSFGRLMNWDISFLFDKTKHRWFPKKFPHHG